jgi:2-amino-4-hydroxy-6-hydroxymethyldihydropteridine diphosphokinase
MAPVAIGLGSNLGDRVEHLTAGLHALGAVVRGLQCSSVYESEPMYLEGQPSFLNACCTGTTALEPEELLSRLLAIEREAGRRRAGLRFGPRELDLDLLLYGDRVISGPDLHVPHPRMLERPFVLWPLAEIAGDWRHPETQGTIGEMAVRVSRHGLLLYAPPVAPEAADAPELTAVPGSAGAPERTTGGGR